MNTFKFTFPSLALVISAVAAQSDPLPDVSSQDSISSTNQNSRLQQELGSSLISTNASPSAFEFAPVTSSHFGESGNKFTPALGAPVATGVAFAPESTYPLTWGPFTFHPHVDYSFTYGSGINFSPGNQETTAVHNLSPGFTILSKHLSFDYTPSLVYYSKGNFQDTVNHSVLFNAHWGYDKWLFNLNQSYSKNFNPIVETATQTETEGFGTSISARYLHSYKTSFDLSASQSLQSSEGFQNSKQWSTMDWINYRLGDPVTLGAGVGGGYVDVDAGSNMSYEQVQGRVGWTPGKKTSINVNGGVEIRQFLGIAGVSDRINPIMGASVSYAPFDQTTLSLTADRTINTSIFENQITEDTAVSAGLSQRFLGRFNFGLSGGFRTSDYQATSTFFNIDRSDEYSFITTSLGTSFLKRGSVSISYLHGRNKSSVEGYTYDSDQYSFHVGYRF